MFKLIIFSILATLLLSTQVMAVSKITKGFNPGRVEKLISYDSDEGTLLFREAKYKNSFWKLSRYYITQKNLSFCGLASLTIILNALSIPSPIPERYRPYSLFTQDNILSYKKNPSKAYEQIKIHGLTLKKLFNIAKAYPVYVNYYLALPSKSSFLKFEKRAKNIIESKTGFIIVNFDRKLIGEIGGGHFSPLAAYDEKSKKFLLLDVARYKYPPIWVSSKALWKAMNSIDIESQRHRGYIIIKKES